METMKTSPVDSISRIALAGALIMAGILFLLAAAGVSDPKPLGSLSIREDRIVLAADHGMAFHFATVAIQPPATIRATLALSRGTDESAVGLAWGDERGITAVLVTTSGHLGIYAFEEGVESVIQPFERYPHVTGGENTLQVNFTGTEAAIWLNEEYVTTLPCDSGEGLEIGAILRAPDEEATMEVLTLEVWE